MSWCKFVGGNGGSMSTRYFESGERMRKIQAWAADTKIRGLKIWMTNDTDETAVMLGFASGKRSEEFNIHPTETFTSLSLWNNGEIGRHERLGQIVIRLSSGRIFDFAMKEMGKRKQQVKGHDLQDLGSGICIGWFARAGLDIEALGFRFLRPILRSEIINIKYINLPRQHSSMHLVNLDEYYNTHRSGPDLTWHWGKSKTVKKSSTWSFKTGLVHGGKVSVCGGIPHLAKFGAQFRWEVPVNSSVTSETNVVEEEVLNWHLEGVLRSGDEVHLKATTVKGTIDVDYTADVRITVDSDAVFTYPIRGRYSGVAYSGVRVTVEGSSNSNKSQTKR